MPAKPIIADVHHPVFLVPEIEWPFPRRVVRMKQEGPHIGSQRLERRLEDFVREAIAKLDPLLACLQVWMIEITCGVYGIVVHSVTIDNHTSLPRYLAH